MINQIFKNTFVYNYFSILLNSNKRFPQSIIFEGFDTIMQYFFSLELARILNCTGDKTPGCSCTNCNWIRENRHPAVVNVTPVDFKEDGTKTVISVKQIEKVTSLILEASDYHRFFIFSNVKTSKIQENEQKQLSKIRGINPQTLYSQAEYHNPITGETISGLEGRTFERKRSARKAQETKALKRLQKQQLPSQTYLVLQNIRDLINQFTPSSIWSNYWTHKKEADKNKLQSLLDNTIAQEGENVVAERLQNYAGDIERIINSILYGSDEEQTQFDMVEFATIIKGRSLTQHESSELTDLMETQETE